MAARLVLVGGGHAHLEVLRRAARCPLGAELVLVSPHGAQLYSGMMPGQLRGAYAERDLTVDLPALCRAAGVEKLDAGPKGVVLSFHRNQFRNPGGLIAWVTAQKGLVKLRPDHKLALLREMELPQRIRVAKELLGALVKVVAQAKAA